MIEWATIYLIVGVMLTEGANWATKRRNLPALTFGAYIAGVLAWPICILLAIFTKG